jgi:hypothetical protein
VDPQAALLALLPRSERERFVTDGDAVIAACAWIVAHHLGDDRDLGAALYEVRGDKDKGNPLLAEYLEEHQRDIEEVTACEECATWWRAAPQRARAWSAANPVYTPRLTNGNCRRTKADIEYIKNAIYRAVAADWPMTVRQTFYLLVAAAIVDKTEQEYKGTVMRLLLEMRREGEIPYGWIADNTRWMRKPRTFDSVEEALADTATAYRRAVWRDLPVYVEVWCEKDALAGVAYEETEPYDVPLMIARGFSSETYLHNAAEQIIAAKRPAFIYHFGDHDPSGVKAAQDIERRLRGFAPGAEIHFERVAVTEQQIVDMGLPTRPTKTKGNPHAHGWTGDSVDLDAMPPAELRRLVRECIERHIPAGHIEALETAEQSEREIFTRIAGAARGGEAR